MIATLLALVLLIAGCGGDNTTAPATRPPTRIPPTPTPRSTALPEVPSAPALGEDGRAVEIYFTIKDDADAQRLANTLQRELADELELDFNIELAGESTALHALCSGRPVAAWVSSFTFAAAYQECGVIPVLAVKRGTPPTVTIGTSTEIIVRRNVIGQIVDLNANSFCRSADHDFTTTWVLPGLILASEGVNPSTDLSEVLDLPDDATLGIAFNDGICDGAALPPGEYDNLVDDLAARLSTEQQRVRPQQIEDILGVISEAGDTSFPNDPDEWEGYDANVIPYEVLVFAPGENLPDDLREDIAGAIEDFFTDRQDGQERAQDLLDADDVIQVESDDYTAFLSLLGQAGWDMAFGN